VTIKNFGNTRAIGAHPHFTYGVFAQPNTLDYTNVIPTDLGAGDSVKVDFRAIGEALGSEIMNGVLAGKVLYEFKGTITYSDVFKIPRCNKCQGNFSPTTLDFSITQRDVGPTE
jgi:hypothetical protein